MKLKEILTKAKNLEDDWREQQKAKDTEIPRDFILFCQKMLSLTLTKYQIEAAKLLQDYSDVALRWCRQSGKTHLIAAWLLHYALLNPGSHVAIVGPSWRQTMIPITKMNYFMTRLPRGLFHKPQRICNILCSDRYRLCKATEQPEEKECRLPSEVLGFHRTHLGLQWGMP